MAARWTSRATGRRGRVISLLVGCLTVSVLPLAARAQLPDPALTLTVDDDGMQCFASFTTIQAAVDAALDDVRAAATGTQNLLPPMKEALKRRATLGEVSDVLREVFGVYQPAR